MSKSKSTSHFRGKSGGITMKKPRKFRPAEVPRYLPGQVGNAALKNDLAHFNKHKFRVFSAKPVVDSKPPRMNPLRYFGGKSMLEDAARLRRIDIENKELLKKINTINRLGGLVDCYNPFAYTRQDKWRAYNSSMKKLEKKNRILYELIKRPGSYYDKKKMEEDWKIILQKMQHICRFPIVLVQKSTLDDDLKNAQSISYLMRCNRSELRRHCFLEFSIKNGKCLGRIIIELYYDHVPVTVQNFLELCTGDDLTYRNNLVHRIILGDYMEMGDITQCNGRGGFSIYGKSFAEENHKLKHTKAGVLSMKRVGWMENNSQFCITFRRIERLDHKNVVFGRVIKGNDLLMNIQYYGRRIGKPLESIIISDCGEYFLKQ